MTLHRLLLAAAAAHQGTQLPLGCRGLLALFLLRASAAQQRQRHQGGEKNACCGAPLLHRCP